MLETILMVLWSGFAIIGIAALMGVFTTNQGDGQAMGNIGVIPLRDGSDSARIIVYDALHSCCKVILLDCGMDPKTLEQYEKIIREYDDLVMCTPEELGDLVRSCVGLQK